MCTYIAFTEEQAKKIRSMGISVIEYKRCVREGVPVYRYIVEKNIEKIKEAAYIAGQMIREFIERFDETLDNVRLIFETAKDSYGCKTSSRFRFVKIISSLGYDRRDIWIATRHTWLARSNC